MFTEKEIATIEEWRKNPNPLKWVCVNMQNFTKRILKSRNQPIPADECFCNEAERKLYYKEFYAFWDAYRKGTENVD